MYALSTPKVVLLSASVAREHLDIAKAVAKEWLCGLAITGLAVDGRCLEAKITAVNWRGYAKFNIPPLRAGLLPIPILGVLPAGSRRHGALRIRMRYTLTLSADRLSPTAPTPVTVRIHVPSLRSAVKACLHYQRSNGVSLRQWTGGQIELAGAPFGRVTMGGRVV